MPPKSVDSEKKKLRCNLLVMSQPILDMIPFVPSSLYIFLFQNPYTP